MQKMSSMFKPVLMVLAFVSAAAFLGGCGYTLKGKVVRGPVSSVEMVHAVDERLQQPGLANVEVRVLRDPSTLNRHVAGQTRSDGGGTFSVNLSDFGAGWMQEEWLVEGIQSGFQNARQIMKLPAKDSKWRILITLGPGASVPADANDPMADYEKFK